MLIFAIHLIVLLIAKFQNQNVKLFAQNQFAIGNALNHFAQNQNANLFAKIQIAALKLNAALAVLEQEVVVNSQVIVSTGNDDFRQRRRRHGNVVVDAQALSELWPSSS